MGVGGALHSSLRIRRADLKASLEPGAWDPDGLGPGPAAR